MSHPPVPDPSAPAPRPSLAMTSEYRPPERHHVESNPTGKRLAILTLTALGVVYGDIGTSPLYAMKEAFSKPEYGLTADPATVYGVLSLVLWSLILVVSVKYIVFILRADNRGEGGILAMLALLIRDKATPRAERGVLVTLALFGAALLYGDGIITPAMSVLGAMEGLEVISPRSSVLVVPLTIGILIGVFAVQRSGTHRVGVFFGPMMLIWFGAIGVLGLAEVLRHPEVLTALNPVWGLRFFQTLGHKGFLALGAVVLAVTGAEALYADMGHFGKRPIRTAWFWLVFPALVLNYFGQGSLLLRDPSAAANPFYLLVPRELLYPMLAVATAAAIIASQALISGAFSLTQQCIQLGYSPRMTVRHTSAKEFGQIYVPEINVALGVGTLLVVIGFQSTAALGAAYGIAVTGTMFITTCMLGVLFVRVWKWPPAVTIGLVTLFFIFDGAYFASNVTKIPDGGWFPLLVGAVAFTMLTTWARGRALMIEQMRDSAMPTKVFIRSAAGSATRVPGTAVFMTSTPDGVPHALLHNLKHNKVLHERVMLLTVKIIGVPYVDDAHRLRIDDLGQGFHRVIVKFGFMQEANIPAALKLAKVCGGDFRMMETSFFLSRQTLLVSERPGMAIWRERLFAWMMRNAESAMEFFRLPSNRVVELGSQVEI